MTFHSRRLVKLFGSSVQKNAAEEALAFLEIEKEPGSLGETSRSRSLSADLLNSCSNSKKTLRRQNQPMKKADQPLLAVTWRRLSPTLNRRNTQNMHFE
ncbi:hypothetical protein HPB48_003018 [Haemaphysalis longicornis]|uniref:Uncharacterized protein n=1 Tax=Haemaphysalis longicornis TaxID=44386 RepID=A0A9J6FGW9_HAELO|nr:hypothetical protein HPB48_003018 [Haemaphysalis longicornis]